MASQVVSDFENRDHLGGGVISSRVAEIRQRVGAPGFGPTAFVSSTFSQRYACSRSLFYRGNNRWPIVASQLK
jgi:hypothetical protein